jgi:hypothetical protein
MAKKTTTVTVARSSVTGRFVTMKTAARNPRETEVEHYKKSTSKK